MPSDDHTLGIDQKVQHDRQDEAIGVITRLLRGEERFSHESDWFTLRDAQLQILPLQEEVPMATASMISPSGMTLAGKYGCGVLSIGSTSTEGLQALPLQWSFAEESAEKHGQTVDRRDWRVLMSWHLAETREQARAEARLGLQRWHNEYNVATLQRPGAEAYADPDEAVEALTGGPNAAGGTSVVGTPDDLVAAIRNLREVTGGFGVVVGFAHDWANRENTLKSWDLVARYVVPEVNGYLRNLRASQEFVTTHREAFGQAQKAILAKILANDRAAAALAVTTGRVDQATLAPHAVPVIDGGPGDGNGAGA